MPKPCPFCGSQAEVLYEQEIEITCSNDRCRMFHASLAVHFNNQWNSRPIEDALQARIAELEAKLETYDYAIREAADFLSKLSEDCPPDMYHSNSEYCKKCSHWKPAHRCGCWERKLILGGSDA